MKEFHLKMLYDRKISKILNQYIQKDESQINYLIIGQSEISNKKQVLKKLKNAKITNTKHC
mgnify:CR=1 FL=1